MNHEFVNQVLVLIIGLKKYQVSLIFILRILMIYTHLEIHSTVLKLQQLFLIQVQVLTQLTTQILIITEKLSFTIKQITYVEMVQQVHK